MSEISDELLEELKDAFDIFDKTGNEHVDSEDIISVLRALGLNPITADCKKVITDSNLGKEIDFPTLVSIYEQFSKRPVVANMADMMEAFKTFDREGGGFIPGAQMRQMLLNLGDVMTEQEVNVMVTPHENADGDIKYEDMAKAVMAG
jgi:Ca2+-binding EF-hand superfamily protein